MRTLQEKYNGINEGKFTKEQFLRDARMEQPSLVTQYNGYDDAVKILKNRGMIQEAKLTEDTPEESTAIASIYAITKAGQDSIRNFIKDNKIDPETFKTYVIQNKDNKFDIARFINGEKVPGMSVDSLKRELGELGRGKGTIKEVKKEESFKIVWDKAKLTRTTYENGKQYTSQKFKSEEELLANKEKADKVQKEREEKGRDKVEHILKEARITNKSLPDYRYKVTNDMDKYPYEQILRGLRVELEGLNILGTPTPEEYQKALGKVLRNLEKDSIYYTNQVAGVKANAKRTDLMIDATPKNEVDKENGLKKAALKEAIKGVIKNILSEGNELGEGEEVYVMQEAKTDDDYKSELEAYLQDKQLEELDSAELFDILTDPDEEIVGDILWSYLEDYEKVEHYHNLMAIFRDYSNKDYSDWEKYQKNAHPGDRMDYEDWISTEGIDESVSLKDLL